MFDSRAAFVIVLLGVACDSTKKDCEHGRDVMASEWERSAKEALSVVPPEERKKHETDSAQEVAYLRGRFVDVCVAQPEATGACIAKIDDLLKAQREGRAARDRCGVDDEACHAAVKASADATTVQCDAAMDEFMKAVTHGL